MDNFQGAGFSTTTLTNVPVHNIVDDVSWTKGKQTIQFGGNLRIITDNRNGNQSNYRTRSRMCTGWITPALLTRVAVWTPRLLSISLEQPGGRLLFRDKL